MAAVVALVVLGCLGVAAACSTGKGSNGRSTKNHKQSSVKTRITNRARHHRRPCRANDPQDLPKVQHLMASFWNVRDIDAAQALWQRIESVELAEYAMPRHGLQRISPEAEARNPQLRIPMRLSHCDGYRQGSHQLLAARRPTSSGVAFAGKRI